MNEIKIVIEGMKELTDALNRIAGGSSQAAHTQPDSAPAQQIPAQRPPLQQVPVQTPVNMQAVPVHQTAPSGQPTQQPAMAQIPTTAVSQQYTIEQLQVAAAGLNSMGKMPQVIGILQAFGIQAMTELPPERYGEFAVALREAGAQI